MQVQPYLNFNGRCEEALQFYGKSLGAKVDMMMRFKEMPGPQAPGMTAPPDKVLHAAFRVGDTQVLASDGRCTGKGAFEGIALSLTARDDAEAKRLFGERLPLYADKLGVAYHSYALSSATTQWGSCTAQGKIRLNWRLIHFTLPLIDYVIAHELAHLREMNHGPRFWATVQSIFPEFETAKKSLREQAPKTLPIF